MAGSYPASVFIVVPIKYVVAALDRAMATVNPEHTLSPGFFRRSARDAVYCFGGDLTALFLRGLARNDKRLPYMRKVEVTIKFVSSPYLTDLDPSVIAAGSSEVRFFAACKEELNVRKKRRLVPLDREVVMGMTSSQITGNIALGQKGIAGDVLALDVDSVDGGFDLIGLTSSSSTRKDPTFFE
jgi:hypothetical protein